MAASDKISGADVNYKNLAGKFNNGGQKVVLKNKLEEMIEEFDFRGGWPEGNNKEKFTMERKAGPGKAGSDPAFPGISVWQTSTEPGGTPKAENSKPLKSTKEVVAGLSLQTKKDLQSSPGVFNFTTVIAGVLALGSSALAVVLRRRLIYSEQARRVYLFEPEPQSRRLA